MYSFWSLYSAVKTIGLIAGYSFSSLPKWFQCCKYPVFDVYKIFTMSPLVYLYIYNLVLLKTVDVLDMRTHGMNVVVTVTMFDTIYYLTYRKEFISIIKNTDAITAKLLKSRLIRDMDIDYILRKTKAFNSFAKYYYKFGTLYVVSLYTYYLIMHYVSSQKVLNLRLPYGIVSEPLYLFNLFMQFAFLQLSLTKFFFSRSVMYLLMCHIAFYLEVLGKGTKVVFENFMKTDKQSHQIRRQNKGIFDVSVAPVAESNLQSKQNLRNCTDITIGKDINNRLKHWIELHKIILRFVFQESDSLGTLYYIR